MNSDLEAVIDEAKDFLGSKELLGLDSASFLDQASPQPSDRNRIEEMKRELSMLGNRRVAGSNPKRMRDITDLYAALSVLNGDEKVYWPIRSPHQKIDFAKPADGRLSSIRPINVKNQLILHSAAIARTQIWLLVNGEKSRQLHTTDGLLLDVEFLKSLNQNAQGKVDQGWLGSEDEIKEKSRSMHPMDNAKAMSVANGAVWDLLDTIDSAQNGSTFAHSPLLIASMSPTAWIQSTAGAKISELLPLIDRAQGNQTGIFRIFDERKTDLGKAILSHVRS